MYKDGELSWRVISSRYVLQDQWITVRADNCIRPDGLVIEPYYVLECKDWVHIICLDELDRLCVTKQYRHGASRDIFEIPCGVVDDGEDPLDAAKRELKEETGIFAQDWSYLGSHSPNPANHNNKVHIFGCKINQVGQNKLDLTEEIDWYFINREDLCSLIEVSNFDQLLHLGSLFKASLSGFWSLR